MPAFVHIEKNPEFRIEQGDIFKDVQVLEFFEINDPEISIRLIKFPYVIILSQDCDLREDYCNRRIGNECDKNLFSALVAPLYNSTHFFSGKHLGKLDITAPQYNPIKTDGKKILENSNPRYHYLDFPENSGMTPLVIDFKHYFTINLENLFSGQNGTFVCKLSPLFRESVTQRFSFYLSRIGLPVISEKGMEIKEKSDCQ